MNIQRVMKAISDSKRREILCLLKTKSLSAGEIASNFDISSAAISRHLSVLQDAQLVEAQRNGKNIIYSLNISLVEEMLIFINNIFSKDNPNIPRAPLTRATIANIAISDAPIPRAIFNPSFAP